MYYVVLDLKWALIVGLTVANIMDHKAQLQNMAIEEVFRHQMGGVGIIPLRMWYFLVQGDIRLAVVLTEVDS